MIGASAALMVSDIPFGGPIGAAQVGLVDGEFILNPNDEQREKSRPAPDRRRHEGRRDDGRSGRETRFPKRTMLKAILFAHEQIKPIVALQEQMAARNRASEKSAVFMQRDPVEDIRRRRA